MNALRTKWKEHPFLIIVLSGLFFRLLAAIFSKGFGMADDHFLVIEPAQAWVDGVDTGWLPQGENAPITPTGHSFFYPGIHFLLFKFLQSLGIFDPQIKMLVVRLLHALYSMIIVIGGYRIAEKLAGERVARQTGILLALFWFMPFLSVRNLVEVACIPMLIVATWMAVKNDERKWWLSLLSGFFLGLAFNIRFQTLFFTAGFGLALLFNKQIRATLLTATGFLLAAVSFQGICDYMVWGKPFVEFSEYVRYNLENATTYSDRPWYHYIPLIAGILVPPISLFLIFGFAKSWRKHLILFLPAFFFFLFHSYFPNKQERFILPVIPFVIILGSIGWYAFLESSTYWKKKEKLHNGFWKFFWVLNSILLIVISLSYTKRNRVEAMSYLYPKKDVHGVIIDDSNRGDFQISPKFYSGKWPLEYGVTNQTDTAAFFSMMNNFDPKVRPNYLLMYQTENLEQRLKKYEAHYKLTYETTITPSFIDALMHRLNKRNVNSTTVIYRID